jgi:hypothetical protein
MSTKSESKINLLLQNLPHGAVVLASWLVQEGYSRDLQKRYKSSHWLEAIGDGAMKRTGESIDLFGALYALQRQSGKPIHIAGRSSLGLQGFAQNIPMRDVETVLYTTRGINIPLWFSNYNWNTKPLVIFSTMLPPDSGLVDFTVNSFTVKISGLARAMMECLEMAPDRFDLTEAWQLMEGLSLLNPITVQQLLEQCRSIKVKRLFLYFAERADHAWFKYLQTDRIPLGSGKRSLVKDGIWISKYQITLPESLS